MKNPIKISSELIKLRGLKTHEEVANALGISVSSLIDYELGIRIPRDEIKIKLAKYYNTCIQKLFSID